MIQSIIFMNNLDIIISASRYSAQFLEFDPQISASKFMQFDSYHIFPSKESYLPHYVSSNNL